MWTKHILDKDQQAILLNLKDNIIVTNTDPLPIGAIKAYTIGKRAKWKDYVDLYFIIQMYSLEELINLSESVFGGLFNSRQFLEQLSYFEDINFEEQVDYLVENPPSEQEIKSYLSEASTGYLHSFKN